MAQSSITSEGQTILPASIRRAMGNKLLLRTQPGAMAVFGALRPGDDESGVMIAEVRTKSREAWTNEAAREGRL